MLHGGLSEVLPLDHERADAVAWQLSSTDVHDNCLASEGMPRML